MIKSELFRNYLYKSGYWYREFNNDEVGSCGFVIEESIEGGQTLEIIFEFPKVDAFMEIRISNIATIEDPSKQYALLRLINELNITYLFSKYFIRGQGEIVMTCLVFTTEEFNPVFVKDLTVLLINTIEKDYPRFMQLQWA